MGREVKSIFYPIIYLFMAPFLLIGWVAGVVWEAIDCGFWHARQFFEDRARGLK